MKKHFFLLFFLLFTFVFSTKAQIVNIPDANFKAKLIALGVDTNGDGNIQQTEALAVHKLDLSNCNINSLIGIQSFVNLDSLNCYKNNLTNLDLSSCINLVYLVCSQNAISNLIIM